MTLSIYSTLSKSKDEFKPLEGNKVRMYVCGMTVYDFCHIGHARVMVAFDVVARWLRHRGYELTYVRNITDIDDKIIKRANENGESFQDLVARMIKAMHEDEARLNVLRPDIEPRATDHIAGMHAMIQTLIDKGFAYAPGNGDVYYRVGKFEGYGKLSRRKIEDLKIGARIEVDEAKEDPLDFVLWKGAKPGEPSWESPWGAGRPGWHIECSVMSFRRLVGHDLSATIPDGEALIDVHSGGEDNIFPHHECEIAQSCCAFNATPEKGGYARMWFHPRFLLVEGTKMSKSKGNFFTARDLFARGVEPAALRLELIRTHYRSNANFTMQGLADSQRQVDRWRRFLESAAGDAAHSQGSRDDAMIGFAQAMNADLNIAAAVAEMNKFVARTDKPGTQDAELIRTFDAVLGVLDLERPGAASTDIGLFAPGIAPDAAVLAKLEARRAARAAKDFARSDQIRDELLAMGYAIKDVAGGKVEVRRAGA